MLQSIALGGHHIHKLTAARHERLKCLQGRIRQRARRGTDPFCKERKEMCIQAVSLGELPRGFGEVADLPRIRHYHREASGRQRGDERGFVSSSSFQDDARRRLRAHAVDRRRDAGRSFGAVHDAPSGRHATTTSVFAMSMPANIAVDVIGLSMSRGTVWARPCEYGVTPTQLFGLTDETPATPRLSCVSSTVGTSSCRRRLDVLGNRRPKSRYKETGAQ